ncbi:MAG: CBS domain-containing protein [Firmicutes bacterium]|nr:CBS domain-containing protein [Bacillota bacterium]
MLVSDRMIRNPVCVTPSTSVSDALDVMKKNGVRRLPVVERGALVGIVTQTDLLRVSPSPASTLAVWEIPALLAKMKVKEAMTSPVISISPDVPLEDAARLMRDKKVGGLPVLSKGKVVGILTETDVFDAFIDLLGVRRGGVRLTVEIEDRIGTLAEVTSLTRDLGIYIVSMVSLPGSGGTAEATFRVMGERIDELVKMLNSTGHKVTHVFPGEAG